MVQGGGWCGNELMECWRPSVGFQDGPNNQSTPPPLRKMGRPPAGTGYRLLARVMRIGEAPEGAQRRSVNKLGDDPEPLGIPPDLAGFVSVAYVTAKAVTAPFFAGAKG